MDWLDSVLPWFEAKDYQLSISIVYLGDPISCQCDHSCQHYPLLGKLIDMRRIAPGFVVKGMKLEVGKLDGIKKRLSYEVVSLPFYDPKRLRVLA